MGDFKYDDDIESPKTKKLPLGLKSLLYMISLFPVNKPDCSFRDGTEEICVM